MCVVGLLVPHAAQGEGRGPTRDGRGRERDAREVRAQVQVPRAAPRARRHPAGTRDSGRGALRGELAMYVTYTVQC